MHRFDSKVAIVTGGASGIGKATVEVLAKEGATVIIADYMIENATSISNELNEGGLETYPMFLDATKEESIKQMIDETFERFGRIDILHNNVGGTNLGKDRDVVQLDIEEWYRGLQINLTSVMLGCKYAIPYMLQNGGGSIINTASVSGVAGNLEGTAYGSAKAGVMNLTKYVATQYGKQNIRCNAVAPGLILTPAALNNLTPEYIDLFTSHNVLPYLGKPEHIADTVAFLASEESAYITGQTIEVDGGFFIHNPTYSDFMKMYKQMHT